MNETAGLAKSFASLTRAAARKRIYAARAQQLGRVAEAGLLSALACSEEVQARRLFNNYRGAIDNSEQYLATIFTTEIAEVLSEYEEQLALARVSGNTLTVQVLSQLQLAERELRSYYDRKSGELLLAGDGDYSLCPFCGYLTTGAAPERCPICGAAGENFRPAE